MTRNTKEVALIQIRSGKLSEMPKALHQSEFGLAKDSNRLFIGNASNTLLKNRTIFPYQNLELLTEFSELKDYFKYSYENNITKAGNVSDRLQLKEFLPIVITCDAENPHTDSEHNGTLIINNVEIGIPPNLGPYEIVDYINRSSEITKTYATIFPGNNVITFICTKNELSISDNGTGMKDIIGYHDTTYDISMPIRKVTEKLDDNLNITDFGIKGDGSNSAKKIFDSLIEVYKNYTDEQFYRNVFFPAGTYTYDLTNEDANAEYFTPFPLISNLHVHGEGIDRTIIRNNTENTLLSCIDNEFNGEYGDENTYARFSVPSNILIEDMTFESNSGSDGLVRLICCSNVTFNRVKFVGSNSTVIAQIYGKIGVSGDLYAKNITFNDCIFEDSLCAANIPEYAENIEFNNCKFIKIGSPSVIIGNDEPSVVDDVITENVRAISIDGCMFEETDATYSTLNSAVVTLGINSKYVTVSNNKFDDNISQRVEPVKSIIPYTDKGIGSEYDINGTYNNGDRCIFKHKFYKANEDILNPEEFNPEHWTEYQRFNYTDILNINTDDKKLLRFKYTQPLWEYINYLINPYGQVVLTVDGDDEDITAPNGLNITENNNSVEIKSVKSGDVIVSLDKEATLELGKSTQDIIWKPNESYSLGDEVIHNGIIYSCLKDHTSALSWEEDQIDSAEDSLWSEKTITQIVIDRILQLNDHMISNRDGSEDIIIEPSTDKVIEIKQTENSATNYEDKIVNKDNAIPNVAFVKKYAQDSIIKHITKEDMTNLDSDGLLTIAEFPESQYGNNVHITGITINVRNPFYKVIPYLTNNSSEYKERYTYYQGDIVYGSSDGIVYAAIKKTHKATNNVIANNDLMEIIPANTYEEDIKYVDILGNANNTIYNLTRTYNDEYTNDIEYMFEANPVDIQKNNLFIYTNVNNLTGNEDPSIDNLVKFQDRNYFVEANNERISSTLLHNTDVTTRLYDEGYVYKFDEDMNFNLLGNSTYIDTTLPNPYSVNYSNGKIMVAFCLSDKKQLVYTDYNSVVHNRIATSLLNPGGDMIVRIDFVKEEV